MPCHDVDRFADFFQGTKSSLELISAVVSLARPTDFSLHKPKNIEQLGIVLENHKRSFNRDSQAK